MKRYHSLKRRKTDKEPGRAAWALLLAAWMLVLPVAGFMGHALLCEAEANAPIAEEAFAAATPLPVQSKTVLSADFQSIACRNRLRGDEPTILIYHTHTTEAYYPSEANPYTASGAWRTKDNEKNVVAVGEALKTILETQYGFNVIHDTTDHEPPKLASAYDRSVVTMRRYHEQYPSIVLFLDLHRDAYSTDDAPTDYITINGVETARLMFVVGRGDKYDEKPYFESDKKLAERISAYLASIDPKLARPVREKAGRYNQHVAPNCLLIEVGHNANTLEQALAAIPYLAEGIAVSFAERQQAVSLFSLN